MTSTKAPDGQMKQWNPADVMVLDKDSGPFEYGPQNQSYYLASEADALIAKLRDELTAERARAEALKAEARNVRSAAIKLLEPGKLGRVMEASKHSPHWHMYSVDRWQEIADVDQARRELLVAVYPSEGSLIAMSATEGKGEAK
jgi:hypothetical protein